MGVSVNGGGPVLRYEGSHSFGSMLGANCHSAHNKRSEVHELATASISNVFRGRGTLLPHSACAITPLMCMYMYAIQLWSTAYIHAYIHPSIHPSIHPYIHAYTYTYSCMYIYLHAHVYIKVEEHKACEITLSPRRPAQVGKQEKAMEKRALPVHMSPLGPFASVKGSFKGDTGLHNG